MKRTNRIAVLQGSPHFSAPKRYMSLSSVTDSKEKEEWKIWLEENTARLEKEGRYREANDTDKVPTGGRGRGREAYKNNGKRDPKRR
ncbi:Hypothetical protein NTJ_03781 [Nesidiocoris tenuis]|uniref:Uncharacterized protein n=1 Tax=Nesidiocoris tenuis TaxID=355587 RepID=A0ABN7AFC4_9HEMI|nr:Hypothetical protein NTJ_03781 [Nesidiocoris tenuis]